MAAFRRTIFLPIGIQVLGGNLLAPELLKAQMSKYLTLDHIEHCLLSLYLVRFHKRGCQGERLSQGCSTL